MGNGNTNHRPISFYHYTLLCIASYPQFFYFVIHRYDSVTFCVQPLGNEVAEETVKWVSSSEIRDRGDIKIVGAFFFHSANVHTALVC